MIIYDEITVFSATPVITPNTTEYRVGIGVLTNFYIIPAIGPQWELYFRLRHLETSIIPDNIDQWIPLERHKLDFYPVFNDWQGVYILHLDLCSPQAIYKHTVQICINIAEKPTEQQLLSSLYNEGFR